MTDVPSMAWSLACGVRGRRARAAPRDPEVAPPFLAVLIGRHHRVISEPRSRPSSPRGAGGPVWTLHPENSTGVITRVTRLPEACVESS